MVDCSVNLVDTERLDSEISQTSIFFNSNSGISTRMQVKTTSALSTVKSVQYNVFGNLH